MNATIARLAAAALLLLASSVDAGAAGGNLKVAKAYLREVRKHLLEHHVDRERLTPAALNAAGFKGLAAAMDHKSFAGLPGATRDAVRRALSESFGSLEEALDAAAGAAEDLDFLLLADRAGFAMVQSVGDPYSRLLTGEDFQKLLKVLKDGTRDDHPGLAVAPRDGVFTVVYIHYGYPAYEEGVELGDELVEVDGRPVRERSPEEVNSWLRFEKAGRLAVTIRRPGIDEPLRFALQRPKTLPRDVIHAMLGDGVGYLRLTVFDDNLRRETLKALEELRDRGMTRLILDLRNNPGGSLPEATAVADLFLAQKLVITRVKMRYRPAVGDVVIPGVGGNQTYRTKDASEFEELPMTLLINKASASASELLAGALQDHARAKLVGETTFGKGVGQTPIPLFSVPGQDGMLPDRFLYMTVLNYSLPSGRDINHVGVEPTIEVKPSKPAPEKFLRRWKLRGSGSLERYLDERWEAHRKAFEGLGASDVFETSGYPDFDALVAGLDPALTRDEIREELRRAIRRRLVAGGAPPFACDLETDPQLQYALVDLLHRK